MIQDQIKDEIQSSVEALFKKHLKTDDIEIERPARKENGDFSSNVSFLVSKQTGKNPNEVAECLASDLSKLKQFEQIEAAGPFLNFYLSGDNYRVSLKEILKSGEEYGKNDLYKGKRVQVEFISANPTGPFTLANGRGGFAGDVLANLFTWSGANVEREYYINDGGNQVKILGDSILAAAGFIKKDENQYQGEYISDWAKKNKKTVEKYKDDSFGLGRVAAEWILKNYNKPGTKKIGIHFDIWFSEYEMIKRGEVEEAIAKFTELGHTYKKEGALWMKTSKFGDDKDRVLIKSDGEKTYFANDVAYHFDKIYKRKFDLVVNLWGADHHGYVPRMMAAMAAMDCPNHLKIIIFQLVKLIKGGKEYKMSKRKGTYVTMDDLLELIGGPVREASDVARFMFLSRAATTHMDFDLDIAKERSEKNPVFYVKYAYARIHGILDKSKYLKVKPNLSLISEPEEFELIDQLSQLPGLTSAILTMGDYPIHHLTTYAIDLAKKFHHFYDKCRVITEDKELTAARLELIRATEIVLSIVMTKLLGIEAPKKM